MTARHPRIPPPALPAEDARPAPQSAVMTVRSRDRHLMAFLTHLERGLMPIAHSRTLMAEMHVTVCRAGQAVLDRVWPVAGGIIDPAAITELHRQLRPGDTLAVAVHEKTPAPKPRALPALLA